jgi:hypothetical protein
MTKVLEIIRDAYREGNIVAIGADLNTTQIAEGLKRLNVLVSGAYGYEVGEPFFDWPIGIEGITDQLSLNWNENEWKWVLGNARLIAASTTAQSVYLPPDPDDGARVALIDPANRLAAAPVTIYGNGRTIGGAASALVDTNGVNRIWFYRADLGNWVVLTELTDTVDEEFPFPLEFDDYFITKLAMRLNPRYGRSLDAQSVEALESSLRKLRARYRQTVIVGCDPGVMALTRGPGSGLSNGPVVRGRIGWMN